MGDRIGGPPHSGHNAGAPLQPTFRGFIATTMDALVLFEACLSGAMSHVPRRPHDRERQSLIVSGNVFIYEEHSSGIKRWTDGVPWSPSRILGNFLLYRELDKPFQPGEKKRAMKKNKENNGVTKSSTTTRASSVGYGSMVATPTSLSGSFDPSGGNGRDAERALVGSLVDSYQFKQDGLVKKTISVQYKGMHHHLVSYYNIDDVVNRKLRTPLESPELNNITPRSALISAGNFRAPVDDHEIVLDERTRAYIASGISYGEYPMSNQVSRSMSVPSLNFPNNSWATASHYAATPNYGAMGHGLPPVSYAAPQVNPSYTYDHTSVHGLTPQSYGPMSMMRRHSAMYEANGNGNMGYQAVGSSMNRGQLNGTPLLSSSSGVSSHMPRQSYTTGTSLFDSPTASASSSQHGGVYEPSSSRHAYDTGASSQHTSSFNAHLSSGFDPTAASQGASDYETSMTTQPHAGSFGSSEDNTPNGGLSLDDVDQAVTSPGISDDQMTYGSLNFSAGHSQSQSVLC